MKAPAKQSFGRTCDENELVLDLQQQLVAIAEEGMGPVVSTQFFALVFATLNPIFIGMNTFQQHPLGWLYVH